MDTYATNWPHSDRADGNSHTEFVHGALDSARLGQSGLCRDGKTVEEDGCGPAGGRSGERVQTGGAP